MITPSTQWQSIAQTPSEMQLVARLYYGDETKYISLSTTDMNLDGERFIGVLENVINKSNGVDLLDHMPLTDSFTLSIDNLEYQPGKRFSDLLETLGSGSDIGFENRRVDVRIYLDGITTFANCLELQTRGIMREPAHTWDQTNIVVDDGTEKFLKKIDHPVLAADASDTNKGLPSSSQGKQKPTVYGDHTFNYGIATARANATFDKSHQMVKPVKIGEYRYLISHHKLDSIDSVWMVDSNINRPVQITGFTELSNDDTDGAVIEIGDVLHSGINGVTNVAEKQFTSSGASFGDEILDQILYIENGSGDFEYLKIETRLSGTGLKTYNQMTIQTTGLIYRILNVTSVYDYHFGNGNYGYYTNALWLNPERCNDGGFTTRATITTEFLTWSTIYMYVEFPAWDNTGVSDANIQEVVPMGFGGISYPAGTPSQPECEINGVDCLDNDQDVLTSFGTMAATQAGVAERIVVYMNDRDVDDPVMVGGIYELYKRIKYNIGPIGDDILVSCRGREYGTWINGRSTVEGYTETHADDDDSGELIENPAGVFESLLRDELEITATNIDLDSLNIQSNDLSAYTCSFVIYSAEESRDFLALLLKNFRSFMWWNTSGEFKFKAIQDTYSAADIIIDANDFSDLRFERTDPAQLSTVVYVNYKELDGVYQKQTPVETDSTMQTKYNITADHSTRTDDALPIPDSATAILMRGFKLGFWKQPHNILVGDLPKQFVRLDVGDVIQVSNMPYKVRGEDITGNVTRAGQTIYKYWWILNVGRGENINLTAIQLHNLS